MVQAGASGVQLSREQGTSTLLLLLLVQLPEQLPLPLPMLPLTEAAPRLCMPG